MNEHATFLQQFGNMFLIGVDERSNKFGERAVRLPHQGVQQQLHLSVNLRLVADPRHVASVQHLAALQPVQHVVRVHVCHELVPVSGKLLLVHRRHQLIVCSTIDKRYRTGLHRIGIESIRPNKNICTNTNTNSSFTYLFDLTLYDCVTVICAVQTMTVICALRRCVDVMLN